MAKKSEFARRLGQAYNKWRSEMISQGWAPSEASQAEFSRWIGVSEASMSRWINDSGKPESDNVHKMATKLGAWVYVLLDYPTLTPDDPHARYIVDHWHELSPEDRQSIARMVANFVGDNQTEAQPQT